MIKPTVGRVVLYTPCEFDKQGHNAMAAYNNVKLAAIITCVHSDRMINVVVFDANGKPNGICSVNLIQDDDPIPTTGRYCEWMEYQKSQAAKTEALETELTKIA